MNNEWIQEILLQHEGPLLRYAIRMCGDLETARDVVQETFLKLCKQERQSIEDHLVKWLFTVCRNRIFEIHRKEKKMRPLEDWELENESSKSATPAGTAVLNDDVSTLNELMETLPLREQEVLRLKFQNGLSYKEISEITDLSVSHVGVLLHATIKKLRSRFNQHELSYGGQS